MQGNDEKNSPPSSGSSSSNSGSDGILGPRVVYMLRELGIHMDETHLHAVALDALSNLPADWQIMHDESHGYYFIHKRSREISEHHPLLDEYLELIEEKRNKSKVIHYTSTSSVTLTNSFLQISMYQLIDQSWLNIRGH